MSKNTEKSPATKPSAPSGTDQKNITKRYAIWFDQEQKVTRDSFAEELDTERILQRFVKTGELPRSRHQPQHGEVPSVTYHEALCVAAEAASVEHERSLEPQPAPEPEIPAEEPVEEPSEAPTSSTEESVEETPEIGG